MIMVGWVRESRSLRSLVRLTTLQWMNVPQRTSAYKCLTRKGLTYMTEWMRSGGGGRVDGEGESKFDLKPLYEMHKNSVLI